MNIYNQIFIVILFLSITNIIYTQQQSIEIKPASSGIKVLYLGVANPISIISSEYDISTLKITADNGTIKRIKDEFFLYPKSIGEVIISVSFKGKLVGKYKFQAELVDDPKPSIHGIEGGSISIKKILQAGELSATLEDFVFDVEFVITEFTFTISLKSGFSSEFKSTSKKFTSEQIAILKTCPRDSEITFENIKCVGPDGAVRDIESMSFTIK